MRYILPKLKSNLDYIYLGFLSNRFALSYTMQCENTYYSVWKNLKAAF